VYETNDEGLPAAATLPAVPAAKAEARGGAVVRRRDVRSFPRAVRLVSPAVADGACCAAGLRGIVEAARPAARGVAYGDAGFAAAGCGSARRPSGRLTGRGGRAGGAACACRGDAWRWAASPRARVELTSPVARAVAEAAVSTAGDAGRSATSAAAGEVAAGASVDSGDEESPTGDRLVVPRLPPSLPAEPALPPPPLLAGRPSRAGCRSHAGASLPPPASSSSRRGGFRSAASASVDADGRNRGSVVPLRPASTAAAAAERATVGRGGAPPHTSASASPASALESPPPPLRAVEAAPSNGAPAAATS